METETTGQITWIDALVDNQIVAWILKIAIAVLVIIVLLMISKVVASLVKRNIIKHGNKLNGNTAHLDKVWKLIHDIVFYVMVLFSFFIGFEIIGVDVGLILWWVSFWIWLAFKEILGNMIAGIMILYTKEFKLWDIVEVQADKEYFGRIEEITVRYTVIRTLDLRQVVLPNMTLISVPIKTFSAEDMVKLNTVIWIHYDSDVNKAINVIFNAVNNLNFVVDKQNTKVFVTNFADSAIELKCIFGFNPNSGIIGDFAVGYVNEVINDALNQNEIKIPFAHTTLTFENNEERKKVLEKLKEPVVENNPTPVQSTPSQYDVAE